MRASAGSLAMGVMGVVFLVSQVLILRAFLLVFQGNEFSMGIVLGNWFLLEALGSWLFGRRAGSSTDPVGSFVTVQILLSLFLPATLIFILASRYLPGVSPWEAMSLIQIGWVSLLLLSPLALGNGAAFVYGCRLLSSGQDQLQRTRAPGKAYFLESAGAFAGGLAFTFLAVTRLDPMETAFSLGALSMASSILLLLCTQRNVRKPRNVICPILLVFYLGGLLFPAAGTIHRWSMQNRWRPLELQNTMESVYGNISILKLGKQQVLYQNGIPSITLPVPDITLLEERVHLPLLAHPDPRNVLFIGGGAGGALDEALKHPRVRLFYTELDPLLIRTFQELAPERARSELENSRTQVLYEDGRFFLRKTGTSFDVILINLPDACTLQLNRYFTADFFRLVREHLLPGGILAFSLPGSSSYLSGELIRLNRCVFDTLKKVFPHVRILPGERNLFLASPDVDLDALEPGLLAERLEQRNLETSVVQPAHLRYRIDPLREQWVKEELQSLDDVRINRDLTPSLLFYSLAYRNAEVQPGLRKFVLFLEKISLKELLLGLALLNLPFVLWAGIRPGKRTWALSLSIFTSGFVGMAVEMVVILSFQSVYGYLYQWIGLLIAAFMAGLALGSWFITKRLGDVRNGYRLFLFLEVLLFGFLFLVAWGLPVAQGVFLQKGFLAEIPKFLFILVNLLAGVLVGCEFPLANQEAGLVNRRSMEVTAGRFYALDLAGAWFGAFSVSVMLVPLLGIRETLILAGVLKGWALVYLLFGSLTGATPPDS